MKEKGQVILLLILIMTVALSIGLSIVQKSLLDVSTASKVEQSSRAFSAAEAGVEKALRGDTTTQTFTDTNSQITGISDTGLTPAVPASGSRQAALALPPLAKEDVSQIWLADLNSTANPPTTVYTADSLDIYWGNSSQDKAAIELTVVFYSGGSYQSRRWYLDHSSASRNPANGFEAVTTCSGGNIPPGGTTAYQCKKTLNFTPSESSGLMLLRSRLLYNATSQPIAIQAVGASWLPPQARSIVSTGVSGETQRKVQILQIYKMMPHYFDYVLFSAGEIRKSDN